MDLRYSKEDEAFRQQVRDWLEREVPAHGAPPPPDDWPARRRYDTAWQRKLFDGGTRRPPLARGLRRPRSSGHAAARLSRGVCARRRPLHQRQLRRPDARGSDPDRGGNATRSVAPTSPGSCAATTSGARDSRSRARAPTSPRSAPGRSATATSTSSPGRRSGAPARTSPTTASCSCGPTPTLPSTRASPG